MSKEPRHEVDDDLWSCNTLVTEIVQTGKIEVPMPKLLSCDVVIEEEAYEFIKTELRQVEKRVIGVHRPSIRSRRMGVGVSPAPFLYQLRHPPLLLFRQQAQRTGSR